MLDMIAAIADFALDDGSGEAWATYSLRSQSEALYDIIETKAGLAVEYDKLSDQLLRLSNQLEDAVRDAAKSFGVACGSNGASL